MVTKLKLGRTMRRVAMDKRGATTTADRFNERLGHAVDFEYKGPVPVARCIQIAGEFGEFSVNVFWQHSDRFAELTWIDGSSVTIGLNEDQ